MRRLYVESWEAAADGELLLSAEASHHLRVLRLRAGARVQLFDGQGATCWAELIEWRDDRAQVRLEAAADAAPEPPRATGASARPLLHLMQALPKGSKLDDILRQVTELGVDAVHLAVSRRSVVHWPTEKAEARLARLQRIAQEACRQCERAQLPVIHPPVPLAELWQRPPSDALKLVCSHSPHALTRCLKASLSDRKAARTPVEGVWIAVGPEGGFAAEELEAAAAAGFVRGSLGPHVLRVETAAVAASALALDRMGVAVRR